MKSLSQNIVEGVSEKFGIVPSESMYDELVSMVESKLQVVEKEKTFEEAVKPVMEWLAKNKHPHTSVIIDAVCAELVEGIESFATDEFLTD